MSDSQRRSAPSSWAPGGIGEPWPEPYPSAVDRDPGWTAALGVGSDSEPEPDPAPVSVPAPPVARSRPDAGAAPEHGCGPRQRLRSSESRDDGGRLRQQGRRQIQNQDRW